MVAPALIHPPQASLVASLQEEFTNGDTLKQNGNGDHLEEDLFAPYRVFIDTLGNEKPNKNPSQDVGDLEASELMKLRRFAESLDLDPETKEGKIELLFAAVIQSRHQKSDRVARIAASAISILNLIGTFSFVGKDLSETDLRNAYLQGADLTGCSLKKANLQGVDARRVSLVGCDLTSADLRFAKFDRSDCSHAIFKDVKSNRETTFDKGIVHNCVLTQDQEKFFKEQGAVLSLTSTWTFSCIEAVAVASERNLLVVASKCMSRSAIKVDVKSLDRSGSLYSIEVQRDSEKSFKPLLAFSPKGTLLACCGKSDEISLFRLNHKKQQTIKAASGIHSLDKETVEKLIFSDDDKYLVVVVKNGSDFQIKTFFVEEEALEEVDRIYLTNVSKRTVKEPVDFLLISKDNKLFCCTSKRYFILDLESNVVSKDVLISTREIGNRTFSPLSFEGNSFHFLLPSTVGLFNFRSGENGRNFVKLQNKAARNVKWCQVSQETKSVYWVQAKSNLLFFSSLVRLSDNSRGPLQLKKNVGEFDKFYSNSKFLVHQNEQTLYITRLFPQRA